VQPEEEAVPKLRSALSACAAEGGGSRCDALQFDLGTALLGIAWDSAAEQEGASLYLDLAKR